MLLNLQAAAGCSGPRIACLFGMFNVITFTSNIAYSVCETFVCDLIGQVMEHHSRTARLRYKENVDEVMDEFHSHADHLAAHIQHRTILPPPPLKGPPMETLGAPLYDAAAKVARFTAASRTAATVIAKPEPYVHDWGRAQRTIIVFGICDGFLDVAWMGLLNVIFPGPVTAGILITKTALDIAFYKPLEMGLLLALNAAAAPDDHIMDDAASDTSCPHHPARSRFARSATTLARIRHRLRQQAGHVKVWTRHAWERVTFVLRAEWLDVAFANVAFWAVADLAIFSLPLILQIPVNNLCDFLLDLYIIYKANRSLANAQDDAHPDAHASSHSHGAVPSRRERERARARTAAAAAAANGCIEEVQQNGGLFAVGDKWVEVDRSAETHARRLLKYTASAGPGGGLQLPAVCVLCDECLTAWAWRCSRTRGRWRHELSHRRGLRSLPPPA